MIDRDSSFRHLVIITGLALALGGLLGLGAVSARAENLPCSSRTTYQSCMAECNPNANFLFECTCLWDDLHPPGQQGGIICPEGQTCCWEMPCEKWTDEFQCLVAGGSPDSGITPKHCGWTPDGSPFGGSCACVPPLVHGHYTLADMLVEQPRLYTAPFGCVCPFTTDEQWLRLDVCNPPGVSKLGIKLSFKKPSADSISLKGTLAVPAGFSAAGATLEVSIGGIVKTFTLDAKGKATLGTDKVKLKVKAKKGVVLAQDAKLTIKFAEGSFASSLSDEGLVNATVKDVAVSIPVEIKLNDTMYAKTHPQTYKAKAGKSGKTK